MTTAATSAHILQRLESFETEEIRLVATKRTVENLGKVSAPHYTDTSVLQDNDLADLASLTCERAVAKALGLYPTAATAWTRENHNQFRGLPDVGKNTEVKRVRDGTTTTFPIHPKDHKADRVIVVCYLESLDTVRILGWVRATKAVSFTGTRWNPRGYWRAPLNILGFIGYDNEVQRLTTA